MGPQKTRLRRSSRGEEYRAAQRKVAGRHASELVGILEKALGTRAVCELIGAAPAELSAWRDGGRLDHPRLVALRGALLVVELLRETETEVTARVWMLTPHPLLDECSPARALAEGRLLEVIDVAQRFRDTVAPAAR